MFKRTSCGILAVMFFMFICTLVTYFNIREQRLGLLNDSSKYLVDFSEYLGKEWQYFANINVDRDNAIGWDFYIAGSSQSQTNYMEYRLAFINHRVIAYTDDQQALRDYTEQQSIFNFNPHSAWEYTDFPDLNADAYTFACQKIYKLEDIREIQCEGLFLYGRHISYFMMFPRRNYETYLSQQDVNCIVYSADKMFEMPSVMTPDKSSFASCQPEP